MVYVAALGARARAEPGARRLPLEDGGATWEQVLKRDENAGAVDLAIDPHNLRVIYASIWVRGAGRTTW